MSTPPENENDLPPETPQPGMRARLSRVGPALKTTLRALLGGAQMALADWQAAIGHLPPRRIGAAVVTLAVVVYVLSGVYVVGPGEAAVVRRFGAVVAGRVPPGLHYRWPWPVDRVDIVNVSDVRRETVGLLEPEAGHEHPEPPSKLQVLSGDTNVIDIEIIVQYQVRDPEAYLLNVRYAPYQLVRDAVRQAVTTVISQQPVDDILTSERQSLQDAIRLETQQRLDSYESGLVIVSINLQKAFPPDEVAEAFTDVNSAREDRNRAVNEATGYANSIIPEARGQAQQILADAQGYRSTVLAEANGSAQAFEAILAEYSTNSQIYGKEITLYRLYLETLEKILPRIRVYAVDTRNGNVISLRLLDGAMSLPQESP